MKAQKEFEALIKKGNDLLRDLQELLDVLEATSEEIYQEGFDDGEEAAGEE